MRPIQRVHFIEYNAKVNTLGMGMVFPKYGTPLLAAVLRDRGYDVSIFLEGVSDMSFEKLIDCDALCFPVFAPTLSKVRECAARIRRERPGLPIVMGGPQVCMYPESVLDVCDYAVRCEGDEVLPLLLDSLSTGAGAKDIAGISYMDDSVAKHNPDAAPPAIPDVWPDYTLIDGFDQARAGHGRRRVVNTLQTSRRCHFRCKFCPTARLFGGSYRTRSIDAVIQDIRGRVHLNPFFFVVDNSFLGDREHAKELLHRLAQEDLGAHFIVFERHQIGQDEEMLLLMKRAGVRCIIVGIESLGDDNLQSYDKKQTSEAAVQSVESILSHDMHVIATFVLGGDGDTPETGRRIVDLVDKTRVSLNLFVMHDVESDPARELLIPLERRFQTYYQKTDPASTIPWDYLTGSFATYFPKRMKPSTLQESVIDVYEKVFSHRRIARRVLSANIFESVFGVAHGYGTKRLTDSIRAVVDSGYLQHLREIESGLYDADETLMEDRLASIKAIPLPPPLQDSTRTASYSHIVPILAAPGIVRGRLAMRRHKKRQAAGIG